jgi:hypothetical protein
MRFERSTHRHDSHANSPVTTNSIEDLPMKYVVFDRSGHVYRSGLTAVEAVEEAMTHDGKGFRVVEIEDGQFSIESAEHGGEFMPWNVFALTAEDACENAIKIYADFDGYTIRPVGEAAADTVADLIEHTEDDDADPDTTRAMLRRLKDILGEGK